MSKHIALVENDINSLKVPMQEEMQRCIKHFEGELVKIRSSRAHTSMVEDLQVSVYGQAAQSLKSMAALSAPEPRLIVIQPWDASIIANIEKVILASELGVRPVSDGKIIRIQLPEMSSHRRDELVKLLGKKVEECRVAIRNVRKDFNNEIRDAKRDKTISEDFSNRLADILQETTDTFIKKAELLAEKKEATIRL